MPSRRVVIMDCFAEPVSPEPQLRALICLLGFDLAVARRGMRVQRGQKAAGGGSYLRYRAVERLGVGLRRLLEAGQFSHELHRGGVDFVLGRGRLEIEQRLDVAAHLLSPRPPVPGFRSAVRPKDDPLKARPTSRTYFGIEWALLPVSAKQASSP